MKKIISLFKRNRGGDWAVYNELAQGAEWVRNGEGMATRKYDGACCMIQDGNLFKRYQGGKDLSGWVRCGDENLNDKYFIEAFNTLQEKENGTYELVGPKINGNPEKMDTHVLIKHEGAEIFPDCPRTFDEIREWFRDKDIEGIVWHHADGRMVKIKKKDFGMRR
jgi:hypothetical protein